MNPRGLPSVETGVLDGRWPFAKVGSGTEVLIVFPGIHDALGDVTANPHFAAWFCRDLAINRTVWLISRPDNLPAGFGVDDMAEDYACAIRRHFDRPDVLGVSMGGAIAQAFAAAHPEHTGRLILATVGCRLHPSLRPVCEGWIELARREAWRELYLDLMHHIYGRNRKAVLQAVLPQTEGAYLNRPTAANDFVVSAEACLRFDTTTTSACVMAATLVIGGEADRLAPASQLRDLASRIAGAQLRLIPGAGHGVFEERKEEFDRAILDFLAAR